MNNRLFYISFIRAISVIMIIAFHYNGVILNFHSDSPTVFSNFFPNFDLGSLGVVFFVMISGASLMTGYKERLTLKKFYIRRIVSIFPMYWIAYVAAASLIFLSSAHLPVGAELGKIFLTVVGLDGFLYYKIPNYYLVGEWFVGMILCLYIAFPILRALVLKSPRITIFIFVMVVIVLDYCYGRLFEMAEIRNPLILAFPMIFGMVFSLKYHVLNKFWMLLFSLLATIYVCLFRIPIPYTLSVLLVSVVFFCTLVFLCEVISLDKIMSRPMEFIAKYSYPAFLVHHVLINWIISHFENKFSIVECWWMFAIILLLTFFIGYLVNCSVVALTKLIRSNA